MANKHFDLLDLIDMLNLEAVKMLDYMSAMDFRKFSNRASAVGYCKVKIKKN